MYAPASEHSSKAAPTRSSGLPSRPAGMRCTSASPSVAIWARLRAVRMAPTGIICGYLGCERRAGSLFLNGLPSAFKVNVRGGDAGSWIESAIRHSVSEVEVQRPGRMAVLSKLAESLFIDALCRYMDELPLEGTGWLAGARDPAVGRALAHHHRNPARAWTLQDLARVTGVSRTVLTERFTRFLGTPPLAYLAHWRLQMGARLLRTTNRKVLDVAGEVGYESEAAFNRAFKRAFGTPPARYRREGIAARRG
jgi:AraC-like DNA-binding protein